MKLIMPLLIAAGLLGTFSLARADQIVKPHTFTAGTPASAEQVNADFDVLYNQVNNLGTAITVDGGGQVGIGTQTPGAELEVVGSVADTQGAVRVANPPLNSAAYLGGSNGVYGEAAGSDSAGVYGRNTIPEGSANTGYGVKGISGNNVGGLGLNRVCTEEPYDCNCDWDANMQQEVCDTCYQTVCSSPTGAGVYGQATAPAYAGLFSGNVLTSGQLGAGSAAVSGALSAGSATVTGALSAGTATVTGQISAGSATVTGQMHAGSATVTGQISAGSFSGDGAGLTNTRIQWQTVTGISQQAVANTGYLANNPSDQVVIALPSAPAVGDIVRVTGIGTGGWKFTQNDGQSLITRNVQEKGSEWIPRDTVRNWSAVASSADGAKLVTTVYGGRIYTSTNSGRNWIQRDSASDRYWSGVASSADGSKLVAVVGGRGGMSGQIYTSTDSGLSWTPRGANLNWFGVASSADGAKLIAVPHWGQIYISTDYGVSWTPRGPTIYWGAVASSADGTKLVAVGGGGEIFSYLERGDIYTSTDSGVTWTDRGFSDNWQSVASSADGSKLVAVPDEDRIFTSTDSGRNWTARYQTYYWSSVASSADGTRLIASGSNGLQISPDSGVTWTGTGSSLGWNYNAVASSADGAKLVATEWGGQIQTSAPFENGVKITSTGTGGYLSGGQYDSAELLYVGNNQYMLVSHEGYLDVK